MHHSLANRLYILLFPIGLILILSSCSTEDKINGQRSAKGKGNVCYGGIMSLNEDDDFRTFYPSNVTDITGYHITSQLYEGLVKLEQSNLKIIPSIAKSWEISKDGLTYTFYLNDSVYFQDDPCFPEGKGRKVVASDFKYCFERLCMERAQNPFKGFLLSRVEGAKEFFDASLRGDYPKGGVSGIVAVNDLTLQIKLDHPSLDMLNILSHASCWVYPKEAIDYYGDKLETHTVGTGPFKLRRINRKVAVVLERNPNYWKRDSHGNQLPYLDGIKFVFLQDREKEKELFKEGKLDVVSNIYESEAKLMEPELHNSDGEFEIQVSPAFSVQYYGFQHKSEPFSDVRVRKAFNLSIDKEFIAGELMKGEVIPAEHGIVPPNLPGYNGLGVKGYSFDPELARKLMREAGYPNGDGFPILTLQFIDKGGLNLQGAEAIQEMLEVNLGVVTELSMVPKRQHYQRVETGQALFWKDGWIADYADPENFLSLLFGEYVPENINEESFMNSVRYQSQEFDSLFNLAMQSSDQAERMEFLRLAEQKAMDDAAVMPLFYNRWVRIIRGNVENFPLNGLDYRDFSQVYFDCQSN